MDDLLLAFRPGRSPAETMRVLANLATLNKPTQDDEKDDDDGSRDVNDAASKSVTDGNGEGAGNGSSWSAKPKCDSKTPTDRSSLRGGKPSGAEVIQPTPIDRAEDAAAKAKPPVTVEALSGYGRVRDWALGLKQDLADYLSGELAWADMSTKLLLSGPPGTGKTTFARALCNTLQIPLVVTSVSTWLEGAYLNDVISRMSKTFEEARELAPSILFVDEIDGIGKRQSSEKEHADYCNTLINKALELLDGAVKAEGVIVVGATNRPEQIDDALRRSGRLETHIEIPRPDIETLVGILAHHLGDDIERLVSDDLKSKGPAPSLSEAGAGTEMLGAVVSGDAGADADTNEAGLDAGSHKRGIGQ